MCVIVHIVILFFFFFFFFLVDVNRPSGGVQSQYKARLIAEIPVKKR